MRQSSSRSLHVGGPSDHKLKRQSSKTVNSGGDLRQVVAIGVIGGAMDADGRPTGNAPVGPCGRCRQVINEAADMAGRDILVWCGAAEGDAVERRTISELLPHAFGPKDLGLGAAE